MHLAYSAFNNLSIEEQPGVKPPPVKQKLRLRYKGYQAACQKYEQEIAAIQQYIPGWQPAFR